MSYFSRRISVDASCKTKRGTLMISRPGAWRVKTSIVLVGSELRENLPFHLCLTESNSTTTTTILILKPPSITLPFLQLSSSLSSNSHPPTLPFPSITFPSSSPSNPAPYNPSDSNLEKNRKSPETRIPSPKMMEEKMYTLLPLERKKKKKRMIKKKKGIPERYGNLDYSNIAADGNRWWRGGSSRWSLIFRGLI